jgi:hypothetical protein
MRTQGFNGRLLKSVLAVALGGSVFQMGSCDPTVRTTLLTGLETTTTSLANTIIQAYFVSLQEDTTTTSNLTTP